MITLFGESIYTGKISIEEAEMNQTNLLENIVNFNNKSTIISKIFWDVLMFYQIFFWSQVKR